MSSVKLFTRSFLTFLLVSLVAGNATDDEEISRTINLIEDGNRKIVLRDDYKHVTLLIGNTGSGKSSLAQWIAGDNSKLTAKEVGQDTGEFIIEDGDLRIGSSLNSKTSFPELIVDNSSNVAFYDCPGFGDTRNSSHDISSAFSMKKVADHVSHVKIVLVTSYPSVRKGVDRLDFIQLLRHATTFIKNVTNFENSFAITVTKVDNMVYFYREEIRLLPDDKVLESIAEFLKSAKTDLENKSKSPDIDSEEKMFCDKATALLEIILRKNGDKYARIAIFRRPNQPGPLSNIHLLLDGKERVKDMLYNQLKFSEKTNDDFGYTISEKSKNYVYILVDKINDRVWFEVSEIMLKLERNFEDLEKNINSTIDCFFGCLAEKNVYDEKAEANNFLIELNKRNEIISWLMVNAKNITSIDFIIEKMERTISHLELATCTENLKNIKFQVEFYNFLQMVSNKNLTTKPLLEVIRNSEISFSLAKQRVMEKVFWASDKLKTGITNDLQTIANGITFLYRGKEETISEFQELPGVMNKGFQIVSHIIQEANTTRDINKICDNLINSDLAAASLVNYAQSFKNLSKHLEFLEILSGRKVDTWSPSWIIPLSNLENNLADFETWYTFLNLLYDKFSNYVVQKNKKNYNVANINEFGEPGEKMQGIHVDESNVFQFYDKLLKYNLLDYRSIPIKLKVHRWQLKELNHVLEVTIKTTIDIDCECNSVNGKKLIIRGDYVKLSDVVSSDGKLVECPYSRSYCNNNIKMLDIYALNTIFIDRDFIKADGFQMRVFSPKWKIIGYNNINLNGASGNAHSPDAAKNGSGFGARGVDGVPGVPGKHGGTFLGIGREFDNAGGLTITANGGRGGPGQHGGNGSDGYKGRSAKQDNYYRKEFLKSEHLITVFYNERSDLYRFFGYPGGPGGDGGNGGMGGYGGLAGQIQIIKLEQPNDNLPQTSNLPGPSGDGGRGGRGGVGGLSGDFFDAWDYCLRFVLFIPVYSGKCGDIKHFSSTERASAGVDGKNDHYSIGRKLPNDNLLNISRFIADYQTYIRDNYYDNLKRRVLNFYYQLLDVKI